MGPGRCCAGRPLFNQEGLQSGNVHEVDGRLGGIALVSADNRIAVRHVFEARILIRFSRDGQKFAVQGWARDLSESGLGAFVAERLEIGETLTLLVPLGSWGKEVIAAQVARQVGTQYGFQFTALSAKQRLAIQSVLRAQKEIPFLPVH